MVRNYKRKTKCHTTEEISSALNQLDEGSSFRQVAAASGISKSSLELYRKLRKQKKKDFPKKSGRKPTLSKDEEKILTILSTAADVGWPLDRVDVSDIIQKYCEKLKRKTQFKDGKPGREYMMSFFKRYKARFTSKRAKSIKIARAASEHPEIISHYIDTIKKAYDQAKIDIKDSNHARRIFNLDESGYKSESQAKMVFVPVGRPANVLTATEGKTNYSVLFAGNAAGEFIPPLVVYKSTGQSIPCGWILNGPKDTIYNTTTNGWMDQQVFCRWIPWFDRILEEREIEKPVVVIMDGCSAHISLAIVEEARARNIILVKLPPNSTHILQVLDVTVFGPSKSAWTEVIR
ncbi:unnamed protein product, partial [Meganyctiphanes norvegica]